MRNLDIIKGFAYNGKEGSTKNVRSYNNKLFQLWHLFGSTLAGWYDYLQPHEVFCNDIEDTELHRL